MNSSLLKCLEVGKFVFSSGLLHTSWSKISAHGNQDSGLEFKIYQEGIYTIVVFLAPSCPSDSGSTPLSGPKEQNPFHFLCSETVSSFSLHRPAYKLFDSAYKNNNLTDLKSELLDLLESKKHVIITGAELGGSVASLFTLWLLDEVDPKLKRPLCITFGSPLLGDASLQQILENSLRNSCFLHVADAAHTPVNPSLKPFGTFLICLDSQCICIDDPETVMELLGGTSGDVVGWRDYGVVLARLAQPFAVDTGLMVDDSVINRIAERAANKKLRIDPLKKLNDMKIHMIYLEWYKKKSKEFKMSFYDWYKTSLPSELKINTEIRKRELNDYWKELVEEVEKMPQGEKSRFLKTRSLFAANNYRRMVEPLDIAEYYLSDKREYQTTGRSRHYEMLEKWFKAEGIEPVRCPKRDLSDLLTFDSCFWSEVEEAVIATNDLKTQAVGREVLDLLMEKLMKFEAYVGEKLSNREVSPEIFLEKSCFMQWWKEYKEIRGVHSPLSYFTNFMNTRMYETYGQAS